MWTNVEVDLEERDETVTGSTGDKVSVRVASLAVISKEERSTFEEGNFDVDISPSVTASPLGNGLCVIVSNQMILFDSNCRQHEATLNLAARFDCLTWSHNGKFIALADRSGTLHVFHVSSKELLFSNGIHSQSDDEKSAVFANLHFHRCSKTDLSMLVVVTVSGAVYLLCDINLNQLDEAILESDQNAVLEITKNISMQKLQLNGTVYHSISVVDKSTGVVLVALDDESTVSVWSVKQHNGVQLMRRLQKHGSFKLTKCDVTHDCQYLVGLTEENYLVQFDFTTLVLLGVFKEYLVKTFCVLPYGLVTGNGGERKSSFATVALLTVPDSLKPPQLLVCSLPRFNTELAVNVSPITTLPTISTDEGILYFVECSHDDNTRSRVGSIGSQLVVRSVWEESPLNRFLRLLNRHDFEKADQLAKLHGIDRGVIQKHQVVHLLATISQKDKLDSTVVDSFINSIGQSLSLIKDDDFVVSCCLDAAVPSCDLLMKLLLISERRLNEKQTSGSQRDTGTSKHELMEKVLSTIQKLTTFHLVTIKFESSEWQSFRTCCTLDIVTKYIQAGDFGAVSVIWRRHEGELMKEITSESIHTLLGSFPTGLCLSSCLSFIGQEMLPLVTTTLPSSKAVLATWIENVVVNLEMSDKDHWPENGLQLVDLFLPYLDIPTRQSWQTVGQYADQIWASSGCCQSSPEFSSEDSLLTLSKHLQELFRLSNTYNMKLTLSEMKKETASSVALRLIDQAVISGVVVVHLMENLALPYITEKKLNRDQTLLNYMKCLYTNQSAVQSNASRMREQKAVAVLQYVTDAKMKHLAVTEIVRMASVPISGVVLDLVADVLKSPAADIDDGDMRRFWSILEVREILNRHDVIDCSLSSIPSLKLAIHHILCNRTSNALEDALKIVSLFPTLSKIDVYVQHFYGLLIDGQENDVLTRLSTMDTKDACSVATAVLNRALAITHYPLVPELDDASLHDRVVQSARVLLSFLMKTDSTGDSSCNWRERYHTVTRMKQLQLEFGQYLSSYDCENNAVCCELVDRHVQAVLEATVSKDVDQMDSKETLSVPYSISRFASLLSVKPFQVKQILARKSVELPNASLALQTCRELLESVPLSSHVTRSVLDIVQNLLANPDKDADISVLSSVLESCLISCSENDVADVLETWKLVDSICTIEEKNKSCPTSTSHILQSGFDDLADAVFGYQFEENEPRLSVDYSPVKPVVRQLCNCFWIPQTQDPFPLDGTRLSSVAMHFSTETGVVVDLPVSNVTSTAMSVVSSLETYGLNRLAFRIALQIFSVCSQYYQNNLDEESDEAREAHAITRAARTVLNKLAKKVLDQMLNCISVDHSEALGYLHCLDTADFLKEFSEHKSLYLKRFPALELDLCVLHCRMNVAAGCVHSLTCMKWMEFLRHHGVSDQSSVPEETSDKDMLASLVKASSNHPFINLRTVVDFCKDFGTDISNVVRSVVMELLQMQMLDVEALELELYPASELLSADTVQAQLAIAYNMASETDYEGINFLLSLLDDLPEPSKAITNVAEAKQLLEFIKCYSVDFSPSVDQASTTGSLKCLPFHSLIKDPWPVIASYLSCNTFPRLLPIAELLRVNFDRMCSRAIRNTVESLAVSNRETAIHQECYNITNLLLKIGNPRVALATGGWATNQLETGPFKAMALEVCIKLANQWHSTCSETDKSEALNTVEKLDVLWRQTRTQLLLCEAGVPETIYSLLLQQPVGLIIKLYEIPSTIRTEDVHGLSNNIGEIYELDCDKIRLHLLEKWLVDALKDQDDKELVCRLVSLVKGMSSPTDLMLWAFPNETKETRLSLAQRVIALRTLCASTTTEALESCLHGSAHEIRYRDQIRDLMYCQDLLGVVRNPTAFRSSNKLSLVWSLWKSQATSPKGLMLLSSLCLDYCVCDIQLWREILQKLLDHSMIGYLKRLLPTLCGRLAQTEVFILTEMWQSAVMTEIDSGLTGVEASTALLQFIQSSPYLLADDLLAIVHCLEEMGHLVEALACLLMCPIQSSKTVAFVSLHKEKIVHQLQAFDHRQLPMVRKMTSLLKDVEW